MKTLILSAENNSIEAKVADNFLARFLGLMGKKSLPEGQGLLLSPCSSIHMMFMHFPIDAVFLDNDYQIIKIVPHLRPWLGFTCCFTAQACLELPSGTANMLGWREGMKLTPLYHNS